MGRAGVFMLKWGNAELNRSVRHTHRHVHNREVPMGGEGVIFNGEVVRPT